LLSPEQGGAGLYREKDTVDSWLTQVKAFKMYTHNKRNYQFMHGQANNNNRGNNYS